MAIARSIVFDMKNRFKTGQKLFVPAVSRPGFLMSGVTRACFCQAGLVTLTSTGDIWEKNVHNMNVNFGFIEHDLIGADIILFSTSLIY